MFVVDLPTLTRAAAAERWRELMPTVPDDMRAEIDQFGELFVSPLPRNHHQLIATMIGQQLCQQLGGVAPFGLALNTRIGVRIPDVCWTTSPRKFSEDPAPTAPEICVEVASFANTEKWLLEKAAAYLDAGALEVIIVELDGRIRYFDSDGERAVSAYRLQLQATY